MWPELCGMLAGLAPAMQSNASCSVTPADCNPLTNKTYLSIVPCLFASADKSPSGAEKLKKNIFDHYVFWKTQKKIFNFFFLLFFYFFFQNFFLTYFSKKKFKTLFRKLFFETFFFNFLSKCFSKTFTKLFFSIFFKLTGIQE